MTMACWTGSMVRQIFLIAALIIGTSYGLTVWSGEKCNAKTYSQHRLYQEKLGADEVLICLKNIGVYKWRFLNDMPSLGKKFDPAKDCSDIVNTYQNAEDGYYWIKLHNRKIVEVWCDVHTDGGGFMLVGVQNQSSLWDVPFKPVTIIPYGPSQWSSNFGTTLIQDFAIQISSTRSLGTTRAHWYYKFNSRRQFGNLLDTSACKRLQAGIGNIKYVKDVRTDTIVSRSFKCSEFGSNNKITGWGKMNSCIKKGCSLGYAYWFPFGRSLRFDSYGSFSYSAVSKDSGTTQESTAFVGCLNKKCCACFGPKGGSKNYCTPTCGAINGGTVLSQAYVWFWVRQTTPKRVWKRCMEFKKQTTSGRIETYVIDRVTGATYKGKCSEHSKTFLNEGTLSVSDEAELKKVPQVAGIISYVRNASVLYVNDGNQWNSLAKEKQVDVLKKKITLLEKELQKQAKLFTTLTVDGWTLIARFSNADAKNWMGDQGTWWYDRLSPRGITGDASFNADMISAAFWSLKGSKFKITRSDDPTHTALLVTTGNCLGGQTFRAKLKSYGVFRGTTRWAASNTCRSQCSVRYGGKYATTEGFGHTNCDGSLQSRTKIGFWCDYAAMDGAVLMIGGAGRGCPNKDADRGIGITEANPASFGENGQSEFDFGSDADGIPSSSYALNLWVI